MTKNCSGGVITCSEKTIFGIIITFWTKLWQFKTSGVYLWAGTKLVYSTTTHDTKPRVPSDQLHAAEVLARTFNCRCSWLLSLTDQTPRHLAQFQQWSAAKAGEIWLQSTTINLSISIICVTFKRRILKIKAVGLYLNFGRPEHCLPHVVPILYLRNDCISCSDSVIIF